MPTTNPDGPLDPDATVVIVGSSLGGLRTAEALRGEGFGGRLVLVGEEAHLPYDRPPLSKQVLAGDWPPERAQLAGAPRLEELGVQPLLGRRATSLDVDARSVQLDDGNTVDGDAVVVATGASPRSLPGIDGDSAVTVLRTLDQSLALRHQLLDHGPGCRVVVVGAGFIGSEVAATCAGLGCAVTVVEALATPLAPAVGVQVGAALGQLHERNGVDLRTGVGVASVTAASAGHPRVELSDGTSLDADIVVIGIGVSPVTGWLEGSGLEVDDGVVCDASLFAADGVVAVGDLARWHWRHHGVEELVRIEHWQVTADGALWAARSLLAGRAEAPHFNPVPYFWSDQYGSRIQMIGRPAPDDELVVVDGSMAEGKFVVLYGRDGRLTGVLGVSRPRVLMSYRPLLAGDASWDEALAQTRS